MSKPRDGRHKDLFRPPLDQIIDLGHPLVRLAEEIDWDFLDGRFSSVCSSGPGQPPLATRLVAESETIGDATDESPQLSADRATQWCLDRRCRK